MSNEIANHKSRRGFTLLEVLMATLLFALVTAGGFFLIFSAGQYSGERYKHRLEAINLCQQTAARLRNAVVSDDVSGNPSHSNFNRYADPVSGGYALSVRQTHEDPIPPTSGLFWLNNEKSTRTYVVEQVSMDADTQPEYYRVTISVKWKEVNPGSQV